MVSNYNANKCFFIIHSNKRVAYFEKYSYEIILIRNFLHFGSDLFMLKLEPLQRNLLYRMNEPLTEF